MSKTTLKWNQLIEIIAFYVHGATTVSRIRIWGPSSLGCESPKQNYVPFPHWHSLQLGHENASKFPLHFRESTCDQPFLSETLVFNATSENMQNRLKATKKNLKKVVGSFQISSQNLFIWIYHLFYNKESV